MKSEKQDAGKELYQKLRALPWDKLWTGEVPVFNRATQAERAERVAVIRAVGVVFSESGPPELGREVRTWLRSLLNDPTEKIRRYAMNALPKVGAGEDEESDLLALLRKTDIDREKKFVAGALDKIGGGKTLAVTQGVLPQTEQKARAAVARSECPGTVRMDRVLENLGGVTIHLRGRRGLEGMMCAEAEAMARDKFRIINRSEGLVALEPVAPFALSDIYNLRCFGTAGFFLGATAGSADALPGLMTAPAALRLLRTFTEGTVRYRLEFVSKGHQRAAVREIANRVYARCPEILNDPRRALWAMDIHSTDQGEMVEMRPRLTPDPRFAYRLQYLPAASHPPLAAAMARLAGKMEDEIVWDPFCGSGIELIECTLRGGVSRSIGTDRSAAAIAMAEKNFAAAGLVSADAKFVCRDFRDCGPVEGLEAGRVTLIITNPPLGMRVPIPNLRQLIADLFAVAAEVLRPAGRLVFVNPLRMENPHPLLKLQSRQLVDMSGFDCRMEMYVRK